MTTVPIHLDEVLLNRIIELGLLRYPSEACGVLLPTPLTKHASRESQVLELPNRSMKAHEEYIISPEDVRLALSSWAEEAAADDQNSVAVWHTHPGGNVGPSRSDLHKRLRNAAYLVVAINHETGRGTPCWF